MKPAETGGRVLWRIGCGVTTTVLSIALASHLVYMGSSTGKHIQLHFGDVLNVAVERSHFPVTYERQKKKRNHIGSLLVFSVANVGAGKLYTTGLYQ